MASNRKNHQDETAVDKMNAHLTKAGNHIANNKKLILWALGIIGIVAAFTLSYLFIYKNPHVTKSFEEYNNVAITATSDSVASAQYMMVADKYKGDTAGKLAALSAGESLYNEGRYEEAAEYLKRFSSKDDLLEANAQVLTGDCYVNLQQYEEALKWFQKAIRKASGNPQIVPRVLLKEANIYDALQDYNKALECYQTIKDNYPEFQLGNGIEIDAYIAREQARLAQ